MRADFQAPRVGGNTLSAFPVEGSRALRPENHRLGHLGERSNPASGGDQNTRRSARFEVLPMPNRLSRFLLALACCLSLLPLQDAIAQRARRVHIIGCAASTQNLDISSQGKMYFGPVDRRFAFALR